ncbi:MAG: hypothetical protein K2W82_14245 [Candidatus Obscuribacterales bacterium]|nr:hypothetical protein [Candidatus Obscuribacterales bacterium]
MVAIVEVMAANSASAVEVFRALSGFTPDEGRLPEATNENTFMLSGVVTAELRHPSLLGVFPVSGCLV